MDSDAQYMTQPDSTHQRDLFTKKKKNAGTDALKTHQLLYTHSNFEMNQNNIVDNILTI